MKIKVIVLFLCMLGVSESYGQSKKWTLEECITYALENNITVKQAELGLQSAEIGKKDALGAFIPNLNASASNSWNSGLTRNVVTNTNEIQTTRGSSYGLSSSLTLYNGLRNFRSLQRAKLANIASFFSLKRISNDIALNVVNNFLQILTAKENLKITESQNLVTKQQLARTNIFVEEGVLPVGTVLDIKAADADEQRRIVVAKNNIQIALISLAQLLRFEDYDNFDIQDEGYDFPNDKILQQPLSQLLDTAQDERFEIKIAEQNVLLAKKDIQIAKGQYHPSLSGFFNLNTSEFGLRIPGIETIPFFTQLNDNIGVSYGLSLGVPIFNGFSARNSVKRSKINLQRSEYELDQTKLNLESTLYRAYMDAKGSQKAYEAAILVKEAQQLAYGFALERYNVGVNNSFDFGQAKLRLDNALSQLVQAKYDYIFKLKLLEFFNGLSVSASK